MNPDPAMISVAVWVGLLSTAAMIAGEALVKAIRPWVARAWAAATAPRPARPAEPFKLPLAHALRHVIYPRKWWMRYLLKLCEQYVDRER